MSQIIPDELELQEEEDALDPNAPAFGDAMARRAPLESSHATLTRTVWVRRTVEEALKGATVVAKAGDDGQISLELDRTLPNDLIGYDMAPQAKGYRKFKLWSEDNGKMRCPSWDLVAGPPEVGGTCPAARAGQSVCEPRIRKTMLTDAKAGAVQGADGQKVVKGQLILTEKMPTKSGKDLLVPFYEGDEPAPNEWRVPICQSCYASAGNYRGMNVVVGGIVRYWWTRMLIEKDPDLWVRTIVTSIKQLAFPKEPGIRPIRVHSTGDFFSPAYAAAWIKVANEIHAWDPSIIFWAPTRSWATPYWADSRSSAQSHWERLLDPKSLVSARKGNVLNFVVRASAYHVGDEAPGRLHPTNAVGTTSLFAADNKGQGQDKRYDLNCPVYNVERDAKTCQWAYNPITNELGCRICWLSLDQRVNFTTH